LAKDTKKKKDGLLQKLRGAKPRIDPELQALLSDVQEDPSNMRARLKLGEYYLKNADNIAALDQYLIVAESYAEKGFYPKAIAVYKQALQIRPNMIDVYQKLAALYHKLGLMPEVVEQYQKAAAIYEQQGKEREALDIRRMMLDLDPANVVGRLKLGQRYLEKGYTTEAVAEFLRVADLFEQQGKTAERQKLLEGILDRGVENFDVLYRLVELYRAQGHPELALTRLAKLSGELAGSSSTLELTAELAEELGKPAVAVRALERAADLYGQSGRLDKVREICEHIVRLDAINAYATKRLAELGPAPKKAAPEAKPAAAPPVEEIEIEIEAPAPEPAAAEEELVIEEMPDLERTAVAEPAAAAAPLVEDLVIEELPAEVEPIPEPEPAPAAEEPIIEEFPVVEEPAAEAPVEEITFEAPIEEVTLVEPTPAEEEGPEPLDLSGMSEDEAAARLDEAIDIYLKYNLRDKAVEYLHLALERNPDSLPILEKLMLVHRDGGNEQQAGDLLDRLVDLAQAEGRADKLEQYLSLMVEYQPEDLEAARRLAEHYVATEPERAVVHLFDLANRYRDANRLTDAERTLQSILAIDAENQSAQQELLDLYEQTNQIDKAVDRLRALAADARRANDAAAAEDYLRRVLDHRPLDEAATQALLELYEDTGDAEKELEWLRRLADRHAGAGKAAPAAAYYQRALDLEPTNLDDRARLKDLLLELGETNEALLQLSEIARLAGEAGRHDVAADAWRELLAVDPANLTAHEGLRDLYLARGDNAAAIGEVMYLAKAALEEDDLDAALVHLDQVLDLDPRHEQARRRKISILRDLGRADDANRLLFAMAAEMERSGDFDKAETSLREILESDPENRRARVALKDLFLNAGQTVRAVAELVQLAKAAENAGEATVALQCWGEISGLDPENLDARLGIVRLHLNAGHTDQAVSELLTVAGLQEHAGDARAAIQTLNQALSYDADNEVATSRLIDLYFADRQLEHAVQLLFAAGDRAKEAKRWMQARDAYTRILEAQADHVGARERLKDSFLALGRPADAITQLYWLAEAYQTTNQPARVEEAYREILGLDAEQTRAAEALKDHYLSVGRIEAGLDMLYQFVVRARQAGEWGEAKRYAEEMLLHAEDDRRALGALADIALDAGDADAAVDRFLQLATLAEADNRADEAERYLGRVLSLNADHAIAHRRLKDLCLAQGKNAEAIEHLFALADLATRYGQTAEATAHYRDVLRLEPANEPAMVHLVDLLVAAGEGTTVIDEMFQLARLAEAKADYLRAEKYLNQILAFAPDNATALEALTQVHIAAGDTGQAIRELFQLETAAEDRGRYDEALHLVDRVLDLDAANLSALDKKADLHELLGRTDAALAVLLQLADVQTGRELADDALRSLRRALKLAPFQADVHERLVAALTAAGEKRAVIDELLRFHAADIETGDVAAIESVAQRILELDERHELARRLLADAYLREGKTAPAIEELFALAAIAGEQGRAADVEARLKEILAVDDTNHVAVERLTHVYLDAARADDAISLWLGYGDALQRAENTVAAREAYEQALAIEDGHPEALRKLKDSYLSTADLSEAVEILWRVIATADARGEPERAIGALEEILDLDERNEAALDDLQARYLKAGRTEKAVALLFAADRKMGLVWSLERHMANMNDILAIDAGNQQALRQLADLQKEAETPDAAVATLLRLGDRLRATDAAAPAERVWHEVLDLDPRSVAAHERLAAAYRERGDVEALVGELFTAAKIHREAAQYGPAEDALREAAAFDKYQTRAFEQLADLFDTIGAEEEYHAVRLEMAHQAERRGDVAAAETVYNEILAADPANLATREALIALYAAHGRAGEAANQALILADRARKEGVPAEAVSRYEQVLFYDPANHKARRHLKSLLVELGQTAKAVGQLRAMVEAARDAGAMDEVEDGLLEILEQQPDDIEVRREVIALYEATDQEPKAVIQLLELAEQYSAAEEHDEALTLVEKAAALQPDNEPVQHRLKDVYLAVGDKAKAIATLFHLYTIEIAGKKRHSAEKHLRQILELEPGNTDAKEKVLALFRAGVTDDEKITELLAKSEEALEAGNPAAAVQSLKQALAINPKHAEALSRLAAMGTAPAAAAPAFAPMEEPVADEVFGVQQFDEKAVAAEEEVSIEWGEPAQVDTVAEAAEPVADAVEEDVFAAAKEEAVEDIDVFGEIAEPAPPAAKAISAREAEAKVVSAAAADLKDYFREEPKAAAADITKDLFPESGPLFVEPEVAGEAAPGEEEDLLAVRDEPTAEEKLVEEPFAEEGPPVEMVDGLVGGEDEIFPEKTAPEARKRAPLAPEISTADFFAAEPEAEAPEAGSRILEEFRPFTDTTPDELLKARPGTDADSLRRAAAAIHEAEAHVSGREDLVADLLHELEGATPAGHVEEAGKPRDLIDDIFGFEAPAPKAKPAAHDVLSDLIGDLGAAEKPTERAPQEEDVFQSFVSSLPDDMRSSSSARTHYELGIAFREMDSIPEAIAEFEKALTKDDGTLAFAINSELGQCYAGLGKYDMAVEYLESARSEGAADEQAQTDLTFELAVALKKTGEFARAIRLFQDVDAKSSNYRGARAEIAECKKGGGKKGGDDNIGYL
jgi:tetratricopeptide (TPR) repeat protein